MVIPVLYAITVIGVVGNYQVWRHAQAIERRTVEKACSLRW